MSRKIQEMSDIVGYVADRMSNDTVLFVLGDHGMKNTGDHGGDSRDEISSTFLVYNKKYKFRSTDSRMVNPSKIDFLPTVSSIYNYLKMQYAKWGGGVGCSSQSKKESVRPVYGIGTALSAPLVAIILCVSLSSMLVLGDGICPSIAVMLAVMVMIAFLNAVDNQANSVRYSSILLWWLAQNVFFYASGHSTTFSSIHWSAAFVGFYGDDYGKENYVIPFILVIWNTYISRFLFALALLLLYLSPYTLPLTASPGFLLSRAKDEEKKGKLSLLEMETGRVRSGMLRLYLNYSLLLGLQLFFSMLSAGVLRRHLMVWKIFTPKFIFEGVGFLMSLASLLAGYIVWARVHGLMNKYYAKLILGGTQ